MYIKEALMCINYDISICQDNSHPLKNVWVEDFQFWPRWNYPHPALVLPLTIKKRMDIIQQTNTGRL